MRPIVVERNIVRFIKFIEIPFDLEKVIFDKNYFIQAPGEVTGDGQEYMTHEPQQFCQSVLLKKSIPYRPGHGNSVGFVVADS